MLFQLKLGSGVLWGAIGQNGGLYWGALSVAKFLGYKALYQFTRYRTNVYLKDIASCYHAREHSRYLETRLMTHNRLLSVLDRSRKERAQLLYDHFNRGNFYVQVDTDPRYPRTELCKQNDPQAVNFFLWLEGYKHQLFEEALELESDLNRDREEEEDEEPAAAADAAASTSAATGYSAASPPAATATADYTPLSPDSHFTPYSPSFPPYDPVTEPDPPVADNSSLPFKKRFRTQEDGILFWFSSYPPKKIIVMQGNCSQEFIPKMES